MFKNRWKVLRISLIAVITVIVLVIPVTVSQSAVTKIAPSLLLAQATNETDIDAIASMTTVFISENLAGKQDIDIAVRNGEVFEYAGSGVIVGRREQISDAATEFNEGKFGAPKAVKQSVSYVITNAHVLEQLINDKHTPYGLRTVDGEVHTVKNCDFIGNPNNPNDVDLALFEFLSDKSYEFATINASAINQDERLFVSGWPTPSEKYKRRERRFISAQLERQNPLETTGNNGSNLVYSATAPGVRIGMSGGPIFNSKGELVGIHSAGPPDYIPPKDGNGSVVIEDLPEGQGIQIIKLLQKRQANIFNIAPPSVSPDLITQARKRRRQTDTITADEFAKSFDDLPMTDPAFQAFQSLRERYQCIDTTKGIAPSAIEISRGQAAVDLNSCLDSVNGIIANSINANSINFKELKEIERKINNLDQEINSL